MRAWAPAVLACVGCGGAPDPAMVQAELYTSEAFSVHDFDVDFSGCTEFVGIGSIPTANARPFVPAHYTLAGDATQAVLVVRVARCSSAVINGKAKGTTIVSHIGISVSGQDTTADINNYTLSYATNQAQLQASFSGEGINSDLSNTLTFNLSTVGQLVVDSSSSQTPTFHVRGNAPPPTAPAVPFVASWWADGVHGVIRSRTTFPAIRFGNSTVTLTTPAGSALAKLIGGTSFTFALLDSDNTFPNAHMEVRDTD